jgi:hypothetical protein
MIVPSYTTLRHISKGELAYNRYLHTHIYCSIIHNHQVMESA